MTKETPSPHEEAKGLILNTAQALSVEQVQPVEGVGRALSEAVLAQRTLPPWDNSAMDGYAVRSEDTRAPATLRIVETVYAGQVSHRSLGPGEAARIMTGAPLPPGADAVLMQEKTRLVAGDRVETLEAVSRGSCVRPRGEEAQAGEVLLPRGAPVGGPELALLLGQGITSISVPRRPRVAILSTGDELHPAQTCPADGIPDVNGPLLTLSVARAGGLPTFLGITRDRPEDLRRAFASALNGGFDLVLSTAGVSVGEHDYVREVLEGLGVTLLLRQVAIKPGKPLTFGQRGNTLFLGLPGNPTSSLVTFELFARPLLRRWLGFSEPEGLPVSGRAGAAIKKSPGLAHFIRVTATWKDGELWAQPLSTQGSGTLRSAALATHLMVLPRESPGVQAGDRVTLLPASWTA
jgi:molybdopterin molybdotransferase